MSAPLSAAQADFYSTAATVIPVLILAYLVGMAAAARGASERIDQVAQATRNQLVVAIEAAVKDKRRARALVQLVGAALDYVPSWVRNGLIVPAVLLVTGLPVAGEVAAFVSLSANHATHTGLVLTWLGLATGALAVLIPVLRTAVVLYRPGLSGFAAIRLMLRFRREFGTSADIAAGEHRAAVESVEKVESAGDGDGSRR